MIILAEVTDKIPSTAEIAVLYLCMTGLSVTVALVHRVVAWSILVMALMVGGFAAFVGFHASFAEDAFSDAIWSELGWPGVAWSIAGPLLPIATVAALMILRRMTSQIMGRGRTRPV